MAAFTAPLLVGSLIAPATAGAEPTPVGETPLVPSGSSLSSTPAADVAAPTALSPARCVGHTDYAHSSNGAVKTRNGPYVSVHGRTNCADPVPIVRATAEVWKKVWHGNTRLFVGARAENTHSKSSGDSKPHYNCVGDGKAWYVGITNHSSFEGGKWYNQRTVQEGSQAVSEFTC